jgi:hypothetical protein
MTPPALVLAGVALLSGTTVFTSGLTAWFVSDAWIFLDRADQAFPIQYFDPASPLRFYRPLVEVAFWIEYRLFGLNPLGYHLVALAGHTASAILVGAVAYHFAPRWGAALAAGFALWFSIHAHEVVFDVADLHNALGGPLLLGAVLAFLKGRSWWAAGLMVAALLVDENGVLVVPLAAVAAVLQRTDWRRLAPVAAVLVVYLAATFLRGSIIGETSDPCRSLACWIAGLQSYAGRLVVRPDELIAADPPAQWLVVGVAGLLLAQPWRWRHWRGAAFGAAWAAGTSLFFVLALAPYIADRFLYIPSMGVAIAIGAVTAEASVWLRERSARSLVSAAALGLISVWIGLGAVSLEWRGRQWVVAGEVARDAMQRIQSAEPDPPPNAVFVVYGVPDFLLPGIPPRQSPFVFHNAITQAMRVAYGRDDITVLKAERVDDAPDGAIHVYGP